MNFSALFEVLAVLLDWTSEAHLQKMPTFQDSPQGRLQEQQLDFPSALVHEKCLKVSRLVCKVGKLPSWGGGSLDRSVSQKKKTKLDGVHARNTLSVEVIGCFKSS